MLCKVDTVEMMPTSTTLSMDEVISGYRGIGVPEYLGIWVSGYTRLRYHVTFSSPFPSNSMKQHPASVDSRGGSNHHHAHPRKSALTHSSSPRSTVLEFATGCIVVVLWRALSCLWLSGPAKHADGPPLCDAGHAG